MARAAGLPVVTPRLLAAGVYEDVVAARSSAAAVVFASTGLGDAKAGQLWDVARGVTVGPPISGNADGVSGTFGTDPAPGRDRPLAVVQRGRALHVIDARTGIRVSECDQPYSLSNVMCLAVLEGRAVVVAVRHETAVNPLCRVWDVESGALLHDFRVYFPKYHAVGDPMLLAVPTIGDGAVLLTTQEERLLPSGSTFDHAYLALIDLASGERLSRLEGGPPIALPATEAGSVVVFRSSDDFHLTAARFPGGEHLTTFTGDDTPYGIDTAAAGAVSGRGIVVGGAYGGKTATVWVLTRPDPIAVINAPSLSATAVAGNGAVVLTTSEGLFTVSPDALPIG